METSRGQQDGPFENPRSQGAGHSEADGETLAFVPPLSQFCPGLSRLSLHESGFFVPTRHRGGGEKIEYN